MKLTIPVEEVKQALVEYIKIQYGATVQPDALVPGSDTFGSRGTYEIDLLKCKLSNFIMGAKAPFSDAVLDDEDESQPSK